MILIVDFGSQFTQLLARRVRESGVYSQIHSWKSFAQFTPDSFSGQVKGIILSGGPQSVYEKGAPSVALDVLLGWNVPILGVCYGLQLLNHLMGGKVQAAQVREYGHEKFRLLEKPSASDPLFALPKQEEHVVWMSHGDEIQELAPPLRCTARTLNGAVAAFAHSQAPIYGLQFHPEVDHSPFGRELISHFVKVTCQHPENWKLGHQIQEIGAQILEKANSEGPQSRVLCALSGGVDSTVAAVLAQRVLGSRLQCVFMNNGLLRLGEFEKVMDTLVNQLHLNVMGWDASEVFLTRLKGITDPEEKRKIIGVTFIEEFEKAAKQDPNLKFLLQGTLYTDVIESVSLHGTSVTIKSHHNVGGLPEKMNFKLIEPFRELFKDEVRNLGKLLDLPDPILQRHPFPGPGLAIRVLGEVTPQRLEILRRADDILVRALQEAGLYNKVWQAFVVLLPVQSVGVMGDGRTYENVAAVRCVDASDGMTASWSVLPAEFLGYVSSQIINQVRGINRVVYDISHKPPATIEWE
jgi:GMP synthase (glutamine-hydrolysing)